MGILFISHSSRDNDLAIKVRDWLKEQGWGEVFLDLDPAEGLAPGQRWQEELKRAGANCAAVIVLLSPNWVASSWCQVEYLLADQLGKLIFPVLIAPTPLESLPPQLTVQFQLADVSTAEVEREGFQALAIGLRRAGLDPKSFNWPPSGEPNRAIYRGLEALDVQDAAIFFGRSAPVTRALDDLRRLRGGAPERVLVILGASGAGKSSFLKAGLISRLQRDEANFLVLPVIRPGRAAVSGPQGLSAALASVGKRPVSLSDGPDAVLRVFADMRAPVVERLSRTATASRGNYAAQAPTIIIAIDQAEELYGAENSEGAELLELLSEAVVRDGNAIIVVTIRSDSYEAFQTDDKLAALPKLLMNLPPIAVGSFQEVIEGPARLARPPVRIEPALTQQLLSDLNASDALPLLAFTLERLCRLAGVSGELTLVNYTQDLGGLTGAIDAAVTAVLGASPSADDLRAARTLFIPALVQVGADGVKRRTAQSDELPPGVKHLANRFVEERLLIRDRRVVDGREIEVLELAHEAILRQWPALAAWIAEEHDALRILNDVRAAARDWSTHRRNVSWLVHREDRLKQAVNLCSRPEYGAAIDANTHAYLNACRRDEKGSAGARRWLQVTQLGCGAIATVVVVVFGVVVFIATTTPVPPSEGVAPAPEPPMEAPAELGAGTPFDDQNPSASLGGDRVPASMLEFSGGFEAVGLDPRWTVQITGNSARVEYGPNEAHTVSDASRTFYGNGFTIWDPDEEATIAIRKTSCRLPNGVETEYEAFIAVRGAVSHGCARNQVGDWPLASSGSAYWNLPSLEGHAD